MRQNLKNLYSLRNFNLKNFLLIKPRKTVFIMYLEEIITLLENKLSPKVFKLDSEIYGVHYRQTNNGKRIIKKVLVTLYLGLKELHFAVKNKINLIISLHGLIRTPTQYFDSNLINKLNLLSKYPITIFVLNSSFIAAEGGISDTIMDALYLKLEKPFNVKKDNGIKIPIGRICSFQEYPNQKTPLNLHDLLKRIKTIFEINHISFTGNLTKEIKKICLIGTELSHLENLKKAIKLSCDCYISGKVTYNQAVMAKENGISLIELSQYNNNIKALRKFHKILSLEFPYDEFFFFNSEDPIQIY